MQVCTLLLTVNHTSTPPLSFLQAGCPSCCPANGVKALKAVQICARVAVYHTMTDAVRFHASMAVVARSRDWSLSVCKHVVIGQQL